MADWRVEIDRKREIDRERWKDRKRDMNKECEREREKEIRVRTLEEQTGKGEKKILRTRTRPKLFSI